MPRFPGALIVSIGLLVACSAKPVPSPFVTDDPSGTAGAAGESSTDGGTDDPTLGGPCLDDGQCDDELECTLDRCDTTIERCRHEPDASVCEDGVYCNGQEVCEPKLGCEPGEVVSCSDDKTCTIDTCVEDTQSCTHEGRDADADGDPVWNCSDGSDCDDKNPFVNGNSSERCGNAIDDDCDGKTDEADCKQPEHDTCDDPLTVTQDGTFLLDTTAALGDYSATCLPEGAAFRDVVVRIKVTEGPMDVDVAVSDADGNIAIDASEACGTPGEGTDCFAGLPTPDGSRAARLRLHSVPSGDRFVVIHAEAESAVVLHVQFLPPEPAPSNLTCGTAASLLPDEHVTARTFEGSEMPPSECIALTQSLLYSIEVDEPTDATISAVSLDGYGTPAISLRSEDCVDAADEVSCREGATPTLFARLEPGSYRLAVASTGPSAIDVAWHAAPSTVPADDNRCQTAPELEHNQVQSITYSAHEDVIHSACVAAGIDSVRRLVLDETSDVRLVEYLSKNDAGGLSLLDSSCEAQSPPACTTEGAPLMRLGKQGLSAGTYRVDAESRAGSPAALAAWVRPHALATFVPFSDSCDDVVDIPKLGGLFTGNTSLALADYSAGCDASPNDPKGAPEQLLRLVLDKKRHVVLDLQGSSYDTLLTVRKGSTCPGSEVAQACTIAPAGEGSYVELTLEPGTYYVQVDGFAGASGPWTLDAFVVAP